jgi:hypothetical protein
MRHDTLKEIALKSNICVKLLLGLLPLTAGAYEQARVISSTPVVQQVNVPVQNCQNVPVIVQEPKSGAGAVMGAIAGGVIGNAIGQGGGNAAATALGMMGGAILGDKVESNPSAVQNTQQCAPLYSVQSRVTHYNVVYEYAGKQYNVAMPSDPGQSVTIQLTPAVANSAAVQTQEIQGISPQVYTQPVYSAQPLYAPQPVYINSYPYAYPNYGYPLALGVGLGYYWRGGGGGGYRGGRWR